MLDPKLLRHDLPAVAKQLQRRGFSLAVDAIEQLESQRRVLQDATQSLQSQRNQTAKRIGAAKAKGEPIETLLAETTDLGDALKAKTAELQTTQQALQAMLLEIPNLLDESVPEGNSEADNVELRRWGVPPTFDFTPKDHIALGEQLGLMDFEKAAMLSGARFSVLSGG